jgi:hypothetical protein
LFDGQPGSVLKKPHAARYGVKNGLKSLMYCVYTALVDRSPNAARPWMARAATRLNYFFLGTKDQSAPLIVLFW